MNLFDVFTRPFSAAKQASSTSKTGTQIKTPSRPMSRLNYATKSNMKSGKALDRPSKNVMNTDITTFRSGKDSHTVIRDLAKYTPDLAASVDAHIRTAITKDYLVYAKNLDGTFNSDATKSLQSLIMRFDVVKNYEEGFSNISGIHQVAESLAKEIRYYGSCSLEVILDKAKIPYRLQPVSVTSLTFKLDKDGLHPLQELDGDIISLDIPTFVYVSVNQDLLDPYSQSPMESALQPVLGMQEFLNDLRRVMRKAIHPRMSVKLDSKEIMAGMPAEWLESDSTKQEYVRAVIAQVAEEINGLNPEDALVHLDSISMSYLTAGNISHDTEMTTMHSILSSKVAAGSQTLPSILGYGSANNNAASTESLLFMKTAEGLQKALNNVFSQALTVAIRLLGFDVAACFEFSPIDLRPDSELEAFKSMKQSRILELLSIGFMSDAEASLKLTGNLPIEGSKELSGTFFHKSSEPITNPYSNTSQTATQQSASSDAPKNNKSANGGKQGNS